MPKKNSEIDDAAAASASINKTLSEVEAILNGGDLEYGGALRAKLREALIEAFESVGRKWYRRGFNRGHREAFKFFAEKGVFPRVLSVRKKRKIIDSGERQKIKLKSTIKRK